MNLNIFGCCRYNVHILGPCKSYKYTSSGSSVHCITLFLGDWISCLSNEFTHNKSSWLLLGSFAWYAKVYSIFLARKNENQLITRECLWSKELGEQKQQRPTRQSNEQQDGDLVLNVFFVLQWIHLINSGEQIQYQMNPLNIWLHPSQPDAWKVLGSNCTSQQQDVNSLLTHDHSQNQRNKAQMFQHWAFVRNAVVKQAC